MSPIFKKKNEAFFEKWTSEMAYVLGYILADGSLIKNKRGAYFTEIQSIDKEIIVKIRQALDSNLKISVYRPKNGQLRYRLQVGSKKIFSDLLKLGVKPKKSGKETLPKIPYRYFPDFLRGYFAGDGNVVFGYFNKTGRKSKSRYFSIRFTSGGKTLLNQIKHKLSTELKTTGSLFFAGRAWRLCYGPNNSEKIFGFLYHKNKTKPLIFLKRKYKVFKLAAVA